MKTSRQRFAEFRDKMRKGLLDKDRFADPSKKKDETPNVGGHHGGPSGPTGYQLKLGRGRLFQEYGTLLRGYYWPIILQILIVLVGAITGIVSPYGLKLVIDYVFPHKPFPWETAGPAHGWRALLTWTPHAPYGRLEFVALLLLLATLISIGNDWIRLLAIQKLNFRFAATLRQRLQEHLSTLSLRQLSDYKTGGIVSRIMGDTEQVVGGIQNAFITPASALINVVLALFILLTISWQLCVFTLLLIPPVLLIHYFLFKRLRPMWRNIQDDRSLLSARLTDTFSGIRVVRSFRRERSEQKEFGAGQFTMVRKQQYTAVLARLLGTGWNFFVPAMGLVTIWYGGYRILHGQLQVGDLVLFQALLFRLLGPVTSMIDSIQNLQQNLGALDRVIDVLNQPTDMPDRPGARVVRNPRGHLTLSDVQFAYDPAKPVIKHITLDIPAGTTLAIVGPSGSGKTTLVNLVARFFDVTAGQILLDGVDIRDLQRESYRSLFAMVLQDVYLFDGSVGDNIGYGRRHATRAEIIDAAKQANAHDFIMELEKGYETSIGERGNKLSGGQKQRLSIARAILADPRILILDEATSSLDTQSEQLIQQSLTTLMNRRTTLVIAHRLSTIMHADQIAVVVDGQVLELGTHETLLEKQGTYFDMFTRQFRRHRDPAVERIDWEALPTQAS